MTVSVIPESIRIAILAPTAEEYVVVCRLLREVTPDSGASLPTSIGKLGGRLVVARQSGKGTEKAGVYLQDLFSRYTGLRWVFLVGIAGGFPSRGLKRGDVLIATVHHCYHFGKTTNGEFIRRAELDFLPDPSLLAHAEALAAEQPICASSRKFPRPAPGDSEIKTGYVASGDIVVDDPSQPAFLEKVKGLSEIHAVEMEAAGAGAAVLLRAGKTPTAFLMIRGISDEVENPVPGGDGARSGSGQRRAWKRYATSVAVLFLRDLVRRIAPSVDEATTPAASTSQMESKPSQAVVAPLGLDALLAALDTRISCRWEPNSFFSRPAAGVRVYWPVRLRQPTPIHAFQAFLAAGLLREGALVTLCIDDFGNAEVQDIDTLVAPISKWIQRINGLPPALELKQFKKLVPSDQRSLAWTFVQSWLAHPNYTLGRAMEISKLYSVNGNGQGILERKPKRLLNPPVVWTVLRLLANDKPDRRFITLGGADEENLWYAWRECASGEKQRVEAVGHLFAPPLNETGAAAQLGKALHMTSRPLVWRSRADIVHALENDRLAGEPLLTQWCWRGFIELPALLRGQTAELRVHDRLCTSADELVAHTDTKQSSIALAAAIADLYF